MIKYKQDTGNLPKAIQVTTLAFVILSVTKFMESLIVCPSLLDIISHFFLYLGVNKLDLTDFKKCALNVIPHISEIIHYLHFSDLFNALRYHLYYY